MRFLPRSARRLVNPDDDMTYPAIALPSRASPSTLARSRLFRRRRFLAAMTGGVGLMILPSARSAFAYRANERLRLAVVGMAGYGAWQEWIDACCGGPTPLADFEHAAPFAEFLAVGSLATRFPGEPIEFETATGQITNRK